MSVSLRVDKDVGFVEFDLEYSKVNLINEEIIVQLNNVLDEVAKQKQLKAVVFQSLKKDCFIAGADIKQIENIVEVEDGRLKAKAGQDVFNRIEDINVPTVAVIDGVALGGGCELLLACDFRLATFNEKVKIGLPEVNLGFVPGFGGTYRLPRIVGLPEALKMILAGRPINASKALRIGLIDKIFMQIGLDDSVQTFLDDIIDGKSGMCKYGRRKMGFLQKALEGSLLMQMVIFSKSKESVLKLSKGFYPAPLKVIQVVKKSFYCDRAKGLDIEARAFGELASTGISKSLVKVFYMSEKYRKLTLDNAKDVKPTPINKCGVLGAGIMGGGIAQLLSSKDIWTRLKDINYDAIAKGFQAAGKIYAQGVKKRKLKKPDAERKMAHITGSIDYSGFHSSDIVIEAVVEKMEVKKAVFKELSKVTNKNTILATNTSALSVTEMGKATTDPSKVIGLHFFNPVHRMPLIEVITTNKTSKETIVTTLKLVQRLGKTPILVKDSPGFIVNRILLRYIAEAGQILDECGQMEKIDKVMTDFGMPMGPFLLSDEVGLDVGIKVMRILEDAFDARFESSDIFNKIMDKGDLGKKTGKGFFIHGKKREANPDVLSILKSKNSRSFNSDEVLKRLVYCMINEAAGCLEEGIVDDPAAIDVGMIFGTGFPPFRAGLLYYADHVGVPNVVGSLEKLAQDLKTDRFKPNPYLLKLKEQNKGFYS